jgi:hypothetical protein
MHALCNAILRHRPTLMSPFSKGLRKNCRFQFWPWHFLGRNANDRSRYDELLYVRKTYFSPEALRNANGIISTKLQLITGHAEEKSLAIYRDLALADVSGEYEQAMRSFPNQSMTILGILRRLASHLSQHTPRLTINLTAGSHKLLSLLLHPHLE